MAFKSIYTAKATVTGGRSGHGETSTGSLKVDLSRPTEMGGEGGSGTNPEELFAIGYAACFEGAIGSVGKEAQIDTSAVSIDSSVELGKTATGLGLQVTLDVTLPGLDADVASGIVHAAHQVCPYSNATRGNVEVTLIANGEPVKEPAHA